MGASSQYRPNTRAPGGGGMDYNGNPIGGGMGAQTNIGGPQMRVGPAYGGQPNPGDLYNPGRNRFMPGGGMVPPAGGRPQPGQPTGPYTRQRFPAGDPRRYGNPRQVNPGQPPMQPGMPQPIFGQPGGPMPSPQPFPMPNPIDPGFGQPPQRGKGGGGGKGGMPGPGMPVQRPPVYDPGLDPGFAPAVLPPEQGSGDIGFGGGPTDANGEIIYNNRI